MNLLKSSSLESFLNKWLFLFSLIPMALVAIVVNLLNKSWHWLVISEFMVIVVTFILTAIIKQKVLRSFTRATLHVDAIRQEDFNQFAKATFNKGKVKEFHQQLYTLSETLQERKSRYDQHIFLVYQLISQLDTPIMVFNKKKLLSFANDAFVQINRQPWQTYRSSSPESLGLTLEHGQWRYAMNTNKWQIKHSEFIEDDEQHLMLIFINIETALRDNQLKAWQQIIRVLSHEIRNSLTPVSSMSETLAERALVDKDKKVLNVISQRCEHLQRFVDRYSTISTNIELQRQQISLSELFLRLEKLFEQHELSFNSSVSTIWVDIAFFEQVMINLIKNAVEANSTKVSINASKHDQHVIIEVIDNGHGFSNLDNLFVPLYTTKHDGQGIGLSFCRNIIEQHQGVIELHNNTNKGVTVMMILPNKH